MKTLKSRKRKSARNIAFSLGYQLITLFSDFFMKTVFIKYLGIQYTGVSSLFTDILTVLSVAELGFGTALSYALYRPLHEKDEQQIAMLMRLFKKVYRIVFCVVVTSGCICLFFLGYVVKDVPDINESIYVIFIFFVMKTAVSYLFAYKAMLIEANQEKHIVSTICIIFCVLGTVLETLIILIARSYMGYLIVMVSMVVAQNIVISIVADRRYPLFKKAYNEKLTKAETKEIFRNVRALAIYKVSGAFQRGVDSIVISSIFGTIYVGFLSYYKMIVNNVDTLFGQVFEAAKPSVGNLAASESNKRQFEVFKKMCFLSFVIGNFLTVSIIVLLNPFITLWLGEEYLMGFDIVVLLASDLYIITMVRPYESFRNANALFVQGRYRPAIMVVVNIVLSIVMAYQWGVFGVLFATVISRLTTHVWYDPWLVYRRVFHERFSGYIVMKLKFFAVVAADCAIAYGLCSFDFVPDSWLGLGLRALICLIVPNLTVILLFQKNPEYKEFRGYVRTLIRKMLRKA